MGWDNLEIILISSTDISPTLYYLGKKNTVYFVKTLGKEESAAKVLSAKCEKNSAL